MEGLDFDMKKAQIVCNAFSKKCEELNVDIPTIIFCGLTILMSALEVCTVPDENGKKFFRIKYMVSHMVDAFNKDYPIDK